MKRERLQENKIEVIYNAHDFSRFRAKKSEGFLKQQGILEGSYIIGIVANFRPVKRVNDLLVGFYYVLRKHPNTFLVVVGHPGGLLAQYKRLAEELGIRSNVRFLGSIEDVIPVVKHFSVGVVCPESEGMSRYH